MWLATASQHGVQSWCTGLLQARRGWTLPPSMACSLGAQACCKLAAVGHCLPAWRAVHRPCPHVPASAWPRGDGGHTIRCSGRAPWRHHFRSVGEAPLRPTVAACDGGVAARAGVPNTMAKLADLQLTLAVSIHAANQALRESLIPRCLWHRRLSSEPVVGFRVPHSSCRGLLLAALKDCHGFSHCLVLDGGGRDPSMPRRRVWSPGGGRLAAVRGPTRWWPSWRTAATTSSAPGAASPSSTPSWTA